MADSPPPAALDEPDLAADAWLPLSCLVREGQALHVVVVEQGSIVRANLAFRRLVGGEAVGLEFSPLLAQSSRDILDARLASGSSEGFLVQLSPASGEPQSLRAFVQQRPGGFVFAAEPAWDDHRALEAQLHALNADLAVLSRENARQARALEQASRETREAHWFLRKISGVLPMCVACRAVKTADDRWEDVASFLAKHSDFISHGYCARCAEALVAEEES